MTPKIYMYIVYLLTKAMTSNRSTGFDRIMQLTVSIGTVHRSPKQACTWAVLNETVTTGKDNSECTFTL
jgi:hypothetical protein